MRALGILSRRARGSALPLPESDEKALSRPSSETGTRGAAILSVCLALLLLFCAPSLKAQNTESPERVVVEAPGADTQATASAETASPEEDFLDDLSPAVKVLLLLTAMTVLPAVLMTVTSFTRIIIVLGFVRRALSVQDAPPNQVMIGLALFLSLLIMSPVISGIHEEALKPYLSDDPQVHVGLGDAADIAAAKLSAFLLEQTREDDMLVILDVTGVERPDSPEDVPLHVLIPSFVLSELRTAFQMGFLIYLPFLIIDLVVASILLSMGMFMLPPVIISTPFKILLFILVDGWDLVVQSLVKSFVT